MSSPRTRGPEAPEGKRGKTTIFGRMKSLLRGGDSSKTPFSSSAPSPAEASSDAHRTSITKSTQVTRSTSGTIQRTTVDLARAHMLASKFNIELEDGDWKVIEVAERVEKPIRMRIHRTCHRCNTSFGSNRVCARCAHLRCEQCPRYPKKKPPGEKEKGAKDPEVRSGLPGMKNKEYRETIEGLKRKSRYVLTLPSRTGGQDLVRKKPVQRVRRTCHRCQTLFMPGNRTCSQCSHIRCGNCSRDPPKHDKYPYGYPGDAPASSDEVDPGPALPVRVYRNPHRTIRYSCHNCNQTFRSGESTCSKCAHDKCSQCPRMPPKKVKPESNPDIVRRVEERLAAMAMAGGGSATDLPKDSPKDLIEGLKNDPLKDSPQDLPEGLKNGPPNDSPQDLPEGLKNDSDGKDGTEESSEGRLI